MNHKVIYTCIVGGYDELRQPLVIADDYDYICFTDSITEPNIGVWQIRPIPYETKDKILLSRYPKILPHIVLPEYEYSVYMDANVQIVEASFYKCVNARIDAGDLISQVPHTYRDCVYEELYACWHHGMISIWKNIFLRYKYHKLGMPINYGLMENNLILRRHNDSFVTDISNRWWTLFKSGFVKRDQLLLMPIYWQHNFLPSFILGCGVNTRNTNFLTWNEHKNTRVKYIEKSWIEMYIMRLSNGAERRGWL